MKSVKLPFRRILSRMNCSNFLILSILLLATGYLVQQMLANPTGRRAGLSGVKTPCLRYCDPISYWSRTITSAIENALNLKFKGSAVTVDLDVQGRRTMRQSSDDLLVQLDRHVPSRLQVDLQQTLVRNLAETKRPFRPI